MKRAVVSLRCNRGRLARDGGGEGRKVGVGLGWDGLGWVLDKNRTEMVGKRKKGEMRIYCRSRGRGSGFNDHRLLERQNPT